MSKPRAGPPKDNLKNFSKKFPTLKDPTSTMLKNTKKNTVAVPSFNKLSPSNKILNLIGVPNSFNRATTATGSVAAKIAPIVRVSPQSR